jgi:hypothetical protein
MSPEFEAVSQLIAAALAAAAVLFELASVHHATVSELFSWLGSVAGTSPDHFLVPLQKLIETASSTFPTQ